MTNKDDKSDPVPPADTIAGAQRAFQERLMETGTPFLRLLTPAEEKKILQHIQANERDFFLNLVQKEKSGEDTTSLLIPFKLICSRIGFDPNSTSLYHAFSSLRELAITPDATKD